MLAVLGAGVMGQTLISGLLRSGWTADRVVVSERSAGRKSEVADKFGVRVLSNPDAVAAADVVLLAVKPQAVFELLDEIRDSLAESALVISVAAGVPTSAIEHHIGRNQPVVRVMPNTPALVDEGMAAVSAGQFCTADQVAVAESIMASVGKVLQLAEVHQDAVTAISGSGPAYIFYVVEAMIEAGVLLGLPRRTSTELVVQTLYGAATMLKDTGEHPTVLREQVSSPAGTTMAALRQLDDHKVRAAFLTAMEAARDRSCQLAGVENPDEH